VPLAATCVEVEQWDMAAQALDDYFGEAEDIIDDFLACCGSSSVVE